MTTNPPPAKPRVPALTKVALIVGIVAAATSLIPWVGLALGVAGIVMFLVSLRAKERRGVGVTGLGLSIYAIVANLIVLAVVTFVFPAIGSYLGHSGLDDGAGENSRYDSDTDFSQDYLVDTPCYTFTGPKTWVNHQKPVAIDDCMTNLEPISGYRDDGRFLFESGDSVTITTGAQAIVATDTITLDGADAQLAEATDGYVITVTMPEAKSNYYGEFTELTIVIDSPDADSVLDDLVQTWQWK